MEPDETQASDGDGSIVDETMELSAVKDRTRSRSDKYNILQAIRPSESEDEMPHLPRSKRAQSGSGAVRAGVNAKCNFRNSNQFSSTASKKLQVRKGQAGSRESKRLEQDQQQLLSSTQQRQWYLT